MNAAPELASVSTQSNPIGVIVVHGFGTAVAMWVLAFITHIPGLTWPPAGIAVILLAALGAGSVLAGRSVARGGWLVGAAAALTASLVNLMIFGSLLAERPAPGLEGVVPNAAVYLSLFMIVSAAVGIIGGTLGARLALRTPPPAAHWSRSFARVSVVAVLPLLFIGGLVTSTQAGMAFPDWPTSEGAAMFLYPLRHMTGGKFYEHTHRLFGAMVGLTLLTLMIATLTAPVRRPIKVFSVLLFAAVVVQGLLGAERVIANDQALAMVHGIGGQLVFAGTVALAAMLSMTYRGHQPSVAIAGLGSSKRRTLAVWLLVALVVQLGLGAATRHFPPPDRGWHATISHVVFAVVVLTLAVIAAAAARKHAADPAPAGPLLKRLGTGLLHTVNLQVVLGATALIVVLMYGKHTPPHWTDVVFTTLHQFNGAILLGLATLHGVWTWRLIPSR